MTKEISMAKSKLRFVQENDMFGTTISLTNRSGTYSETLVTGFNPSNPLRNMSKSVKTGYLFRSPNIDVNDWPSTFNALHNCEGKFNLTAEMDEKDGKTCVTAWVRLEEREDAALFAWTNVEVWQKWSDELEAASREEEKSRKKAKVFVDKDGKIKATVSVTTLGD